MDAVSFTLTIDGVPAAPELLAVLQQIEVEDHAEMADMMRLRLAIGVKDGCSSWTVVDENVFSRLAKIRVTVNVGSGRSEPLMEAYVVETNATFANQPGQSVLTVVAMEPTVRMNLKERVRSWPNVADSDIAQTIFGEYKYSPDVDQTQPTRREADYTTIQRGTDIHFLQNLARRNGYECYVELNPRSGVVEGHFHPPRLQLMPQGVLSVNMGEATNVNSFATRYDMLRPTTAKVTGLDIATKSDQPAQSQTPALRKLGKSSALSSGTDSPREILPSQTGLSETGELQTYAQAVVDRSAWAITGEGELNTVAYGGVLRAKRPVLVRGAGQQFSGLYHVQRVLHTLTGDGYTQQFSLRRNASGLSGQENFVQDTALPSGASTAG